MCGCVYVSGLLDLMEKQCPLGCSLFCRTSVVEPVAFCFPEIYVVPIQGDFSYTVIA